MMSIKFEDKSHEELEATSTERYTSADTHMPSRTVPCPPLYQSNNNSNEEEEEHSIITSNLPKDTPVGILICLPVKSLLRFGTIYSRVLTSYIKLHVAHQLSLPTSTLTGYNIENFSWFWPDPFLLHLYPFTCNIEQRSFTINHQLPLPFAIDDAKDYTKF
ncbi:hypothetical protein FXO38_00034 [Capsicum annuum]|nr:hypothetical protein FXO37_21149 [Capsicum annuum]KAF3684911.1 hypothetical protein FXO38_00034 [Capsicum annuum]